MSYYNLPSDHIKLLRSLSFAETERHYLQSWIINNTVKNLPQHDSIKNVMKICIKNK